jgi:hypothetical protein
MCSSISTRSAHRSRCRAPVVCLLLTICLARLALAQVEGLRVPATVTAGAPVFISTQGDGEAAFYLVGPSHTVKRQVPLGPEIQLRDEVRTAGRYVAILCAASCWSASFFVTPADPAGLSLLVHPSRVPVGQRDAISAVVFPFDRFHNLVLAPVAVGFRFTVGGENFMAHQTPTQNAVAWFRASSGQRAGNAQVVASVNDLSVHRVVQQVPSDPCHLRIKAQRTSNGIAVETEPVRDCAGNPVPDGTIVTFTASDARGKSTVDAPIKRGVARAEVLATGEAVISAASGVTLGNELRIGGQP